MGTLGGLREVKYFQNSIETLDLGCFSVDDYNRQHVYDLIFYYYYLFLLGGISFVSNLWEFHLLINFFSLFVSVSPEWRYNVEQVMAGTMYHLTLEAEDTDHPKLFKEKVWVKPWENFKCLEEFKPMEKPFVSRANLLIE